MLYVFVYAVRAVASVLPLLSFTCVPSFVFVFVYVLTVFFFCARLVRSSWFSLSSPRALATKFFFYCVFSFFLSTAHSPGEIVLVELFPPRGIAATPALAFLER